LVTVSIDGILVGDPARLDNPAWLDSGWTFSLPAAMLSAGSHTLTAVASDSPHLSTWLAVKPFSVTSDAAP
jgi:hypothetical protein